MTGLEIIILIAGAALFAISFFIRKDEKQEAAGEDASASKIFAERKSAELQDEEIKRRVQEILEEQSLEVLSEAEEKLNRLSNDKIIAVDEFSSQVLEKIKSNNEEVIFLYDMFQKKEEEMKSALNKLEQARRENKELLSRLEDTESSAGKIKEELAQGEDPLLFQPLKEDASHTQAAMLEKEKSRADAKEAEKELAPEEKSQQEQVLRLYRAHKSVKEISKQLSIGQGEVQLIIDLYGR